jgi:small redox-active disulfide protein 2
MITIKILGPGCANCKRLDQLTQRVLTQLGLEAEVVKLTDPREYADYDVMTTPGLVISEKTVSSGRIPSVSELTEFITSAVAAG